MSFAQDLRRQKQETARVKLTLQIGEMELCLCGHRVQSAPGNFKAALLWISTPARLRGGRKQKHEKAQGPKEASGLNLLSNKKPQECINNS